MSFNIRGTLEQVQGYLQASGYFAHTQVGELKTPPGPGLAASVFMERVAVTQLTLTGTIESHVVTIRLYRSSLAEPQEEIELDLAEAVSKVASDLLGDFDLGATVRNIDAGGQHGQGLHADWGYADVGGTTYRTTDISLPLIVDDSATLAP